MIHELGATNDGRPKRREENVQSARCRSAIVIRLALEELTKGDSQQSRRPGEATPPAALPSSRHTPPPQHNGMDYQAGKQSPTGRPDQEAYCWALPTERIVRSNFVTFPRRS